MFVSLFVCLFSAFPILFAAKFYANPAINERLNLDNTSIYYQSHLKGRVRDQTEPLAKVVEDDDPLEDLGDFPFGWDDSDHEEIKFEEENSIRSKASSESDLEEECFFLGEEEAEEISVQQMVANQASPKPTDVNPLPSQVKKQDSKSYNPYNGSFYGSYSDSEASSFDIPMVDEPAHLKVSYPDFDTFTDEESIPSPFPVTVKFTSIDHHALRNSQTATPISDANQRISGLSKLLSASTSPVPTSDTGSLRATPVNHKLRNFNMTNAPTIAKALKNLHDDEN